MVVGDANAKIGRERIYESIVDNQDSNDNGRRLIEFAEEQIIKIMSTLFKRKEIHKDTQTSPDGAYVNQIDRVCINENHKSIIKNVKSCRGADLVLEDNLVRIDLKIEKPTKRKESK